MEPKKVTAVYFSAVGNTKKVVEAIAVELAEALQAAWEAVDFTLPAARQQARKFAADELVVFGVPTYAGRVPNKVLPFVQELFFGAATPVVSVVTFGNRNFDSALAELCQELAGNGFVPFVAAAFACCHVFSDEIAPGRPDAQDWEELRRFAGRAVEKLHAVEDVQELAQIEVAGAGEAGVVGSYYTPLGLDGQPAKFLKAKPVTDPGKCDGCGICAQVCPMGSIDLPDAAQVPGICIKCHACVRKCPRGAKHFADEAFCSHVAMLETNCTRRAENAIFI